MSYFALIAAAGIGKRFQHETPKQYAVLHGKTVIEHALQAFITHPQIEKIGVIIAPQDHFWSELLIAQHPKIFNILGGDERQRSVLNGLQALHAYAAADDWVLVHDAARPCLQKSDLEKLMMTLADHPVGGILGSKMHNTLKLVDKANQVVQTIDRNTVWHAYTPQMFRFAKLLRALEKAQQAQMHLTDEAAAMEYIGAYPFVVEGSTSNIKITRPEDLALAEFYLAKFG